MTAPAPDWPDAEFEFDPNRSSPVMTGEEHEAWLAAENERVALAKKAAKKIAKHIDLPADAWSANPFASVEFPLGAFLEPDGYQTIQRMKKPNTRSYAHHMPRTLALARTIHQAIPEVAVWGKQAADRKAAWETITEGTWVMKKWQKTAMTEWEVLKMLADPNARTLASTDAKGDQYSRVGHIRIDIDLDRTFDRWWDDDAHAELAGEIGLVHDVFNHFGLAVEVFRTGNRGIQSVAPIPWMPRSAAWVLTEAIRTVLRGTRRRDWRATDFKTSLQGLMRLPLGLHKLSRSLALFLGHDGGVRPLEAQVTAFVNAFVVRPDDYSWVWTEEMRPRLGTAHEVPAITLGEIVAEYPNNPLVEQFFEACREFDVKGWVKSTECKSHTKEAEDLTNMVECAAECESHTKCEEGTVGRGSGHRMLGAAPAKLKAIGQAILDAGFNKGESFGYYVNVMHGVKGKNAIGWALVVNDGNRDAAKAFLDQQAEGVPGTPEDIAARKALIAWGTEHNDTYERFMRRATMPDHKTLYVDVAEHDAAVAEQVLAALPELRQASTARKKRFTDKSLAVIRQTLELMIALSRASADGLIRVSERTLASNIGVAHADVVRNLVWITKGRPECLIEAVEVVEKPAKITAPTVYKLGPGI